MPIEKVRNNGTVYRKKLNAVRPFPSGGAGGFLIITDETAAPIPPKTVMGDALTARNTYFASYIDPGATVVENFESFVFGASWDAQVMTSNGNTSAVNTGAGLGEVTDDGATAGTGQFNTTSGGAQFGLVDDAGSVLFTFGSLLSGFCCYITDAGDFGTQWSMRLTDEFGAVNTYLIPHRLVPVDGNLVFWGFIDGSGLRYQSIELIPSAANGDAIGVDDIGLFTLAQLL